ncbi:hypothetical protein GOP47_0011631 [Adiantum capillus-veneris]|uniref:Transferrin-like domain-containing protein n=1 Tax=Adiantum capillus-veneris TaxID=13818 RepID=A0A9D4UT52_ADICA|nr:hypothetical protein GOP47_0011631 [Adiantum capillus-veneris]
MAIQGMAFFFKRLVVFVAMIQGSTFLPLAMAATPPSQAPESSPSPIADVPAVTGQDQASEPSPQIPENAPSPSTSLPGPASSPSFTGPSTSPGPSSPEMGEPPDEGEEAADSNHTVLWCAVRDEFSDCEYYLSLLNTGEYKWSCVQKQSAMECMEAMKAKKVDLISLDAGLAYVAFSHYSMKALMAEEYCFHKRSYEAVAVVNKASCDENSGLSLRNFRGRKSCHPGYRTAAGWNFPVHFLIKTGLATLSFDRSDTTVVDNFFSETCAPSEFEGSGLCTSCGNNGSCDASVSDVYQGYSGSFRCLVERVGDIAFLRSDTVARLSSDGLNAQKWSTKSVNEFMYLCPSGGCRPINDNIGDCKFASVPANVIMTYNSQSNAKTNAIIKTLLNATWTDAVYSGRNQQDHLLSASTQSLGEVQQLTRSYLGEAAIIAQVMNSLQDVDVSILPESGGYHISGSVCFCFIISLVVASLPMVLL